MNGCESMSVGDDDSPPPTAPVSFSQFFIEVSLSLGKSERIDDWDVMLTLERVASKKAWLFVQSIDGTKSFRLEVREGEVVDIPINGIEDVDILEIKPHSILLRYSYGRKLPG